MAFDKDVMIRCVTLSGDMFDPVGTLTGGMHYTTNVCTLAYAHTHTAHTCTNARICLVYYNNLWCLIGSRPKGPPMLIELLKLKDVSAQLYDCRSQLSSLESELKKINELAARYTVFTLSLNTSHVIVSHCL